MWTAKPEGELVEGVIRIPSRLCHAKPDTNEKHEFDRLVTENIQRWADWRAKRGWFIASTPKVRGPFDPPTTTEKDEADPDEKWYFAIARFKRETPIYVPLDDLLHERDMAQRYGIDLEADRLPWNDDIEKDPQDSGWVNPMEYAEARRKALGLKREDFLLGPLDEPL